MQLERDFEANRTAWAEMPDVEGANRLGTVKPSANLLAEHLITKDERTPLIAWQYVGRGKILSLAVDTTWRWEMMRPRASEDEGIPEGTDYFRRFWGNAIRFLAPDPRIHPERPQISRRESDAEVGQTITLATRLVDRTHRPIRKADLTIYITSPTGKQTRMYPSDSHKKAGVYEYQIALEEAGAWKIEAIYNEADVRAAIAKAEEELVRAKAKKDRPAMKVAQQHIVAAKSRIASDVIIAGESREEVKSGRAKPDALYALAQAGGGKVYTPAEVDALAQALRLRSHSVTQGYAIAVWNLPAIMIIFILIVCIDCYIRKRRGLV